MSKTTAPDGKEGQVESVLPTWSADTELDLADHTELGFVAAAQIIAAALELKDWYDRAQQAAMARYGAVGFEAAAVTALAVGRAARVSRPGLQRDRRCSGTVQSMSAIDQERFELALNRVVSLMTGAYVGGVVALGLHLGLYEAMREATPLTSEALANGTGLNERWVREWLFGQAAAGIIDHVGDGWFVLTPEMGVLLADQESVFFLGGHFQSLPNRIALLPRLEQAFRSGGGVSFDERGPEAAEDVERNLANWYRTMLVPVALPMLDGVVDRLRAGAKVADVGCGTGVALFEMAKAFPASEFHGYETSPHAIARAEANRPDGRTNVTFHLVDTEPLPATGTFDLVCTFDCLHDMAHPGDVAAAVRAALRDDGWWFILDMRCAPTFEGNLERGDIAAIMYAISVYSCLPSALSEPNGAGLGTCGLPEPAMRDLVAWAGFSSFRTLPLDNPVNAFYEARP